VRTLRVRLLGELQVEGCDLAARWGPPRRGPGVRRRRFRAVPRRTAAARFG